MTVNEKYQQAQKSGAAIHTQESPKSEPTYSAPASTSSSHNKGLLYCLIAIVVLLVLAVISCPKEVEHRSAVTPVVTDLIQQNVNGLAGSFGLNMQEVQKNNLTNFFYESMIGKQVEQMMTNNFYVSDHLIYSTGYIMSNEQTVRISFGCFGHVFTLGRLEGKFANGLNLD